MKCKHENADHLFAGDWFAPYVDGIQTWNGVAQCEQLRCLDCGAWLSLGPSDEHASEQVEIEIRAAEIAADPPADVVGVHRSKMEDCHLCGYGYAMGIPNALGEPWEEPDVPTRNWHAGYLARCIAEHEEPLTLEDVKAALKAGAEQRQAYERTLKRSPRR